MAGVFSSFSSIVNSALVYKSEPSWCIEVRHCLAMRKVAATVDWKLDLKLGKKWFRTCLDTFSVHEMFLQEFILDA